MNGAYRGDDDVGRLMHDFCCADPRDMHEGPLRDRALYFKESEEGVETMCKVFEEIEARGREEGREEGRAAEREENRRNLLTTVASMVGDGLLSLQDAIARFGFTEPELRALM